MKNKDLEIRVKLYTEVKPRKVGEYVMGERIDLRDYIGNPEYIDLEDVLVPFYGRFSKGNKDELIVVSTREMERVFNKLVEKVICNKKEVEAVQKILQDSKSDSIEREKGK